MKVLILWADSRSSNLGVQVLAHGMRALAKKAWGADTEVEFQDYGVGDSDVGFGTRAILSDIGRKNGALKSKLRRYDLLIDSGAGDSFADIYGFKRLFWMFNANRLARSLRIPVILGPQTIGPFDRKWGRAIGRYVMKNAVQVHARDRASAKYASSDLKVPVDVTSTDVVFALPVPQMQKTHDVLFNVSGLLWQENSHVQAASYQRLVRETIAALRASGRNVVLFSHVIESPSADNDVPVCRSLATELNLDVLVPEDVEEARSMAASARLVIGSRMHACLNAMSVGTPALPLAYSRKFAPLMEDIGWSHVLDLRTATLQSTQIVRLAEELLDGRHDGELAKLREEAETRLSISAEAMASCTNAQA